MRWWLPDAGSTFAGPIDALFLAILIITGIALVLVEAGLVTFVIRYSPPGGCRNRLRAREGPSPPGSGRPRPASASWAARSCGGWGTTRCGRACSSPRPTSIRPGSLNKPPEEPNDERRARQAARRG